jgi:hypothetical protein
VENLQDISNGAMWDGDDQAGEWEDEGGAGDVEDPMGDDLVPVPRKVLRRYFRTAGLCYPL